jgi:DNA repair exonuclease SbcCD ATPase subunit
MSTSEHATGTDVSDLVEDLREAGERRADLAARVEERGEERLERLADAYRGAERLLDRYEDRATDYDDFAGFVEFQDAFVEFVEGLDDDLPEREAFEAADETFQKSRLTEDDFAAAREALAPAREAATLLDRYREARERFGEVRHEARQHAADLDERCEELERLLALGATDLDVPVDELRETVEAYNESVREAFTQFRRERPARELLSLVDEAADRPFVAFRAPPTRLLEYVRESEVGEEPVTTLLEYADYSNQKLGHYVDAPHDLQRHVATNRSYLDRLDGEPLTFAWPPRPASEVEFRAKEYQRVLTGFAPDETVARLRELRDLARDAGRYGDLREAAHVLDRLEEGERERLEDGSLSRELAETRRARDRLHEALAAVAGD